MSGGINPADDFANATLDEYIEEKTRDQFFQDMVAIGALESRVGINRMHGGDNIAEILNLAENTRGGSYQGFDVFNHQPIETLKTAYYRFSKYQWPIVAGADEILRNRGSQNEIIDLWMTKADIAMRSMRHRLNKDCYTDGTGNNSKNLTGFAASVSSSGTYGQVSRTTFTQWQSVQTAVGGALQIVGSTGLIKLLHDTALGSESESMIDLLFATQAIVEEYEALLLPDVRYSGVSGVGDGSFRSIQFKGRDFRWDRDAAAGKVFAVASDTFKLCIHPERDFATTPIRDPMKGTADQDAYSSDILLWIQPICIEPRRNGVLTGVV